jgi:DNA oxidative demethylase
MAELLDLLEATAANWLALFRRYLDDAAQLALAGEIAELVLQAPWFVPRTLRSGKAFSVKMTNCGCLGWVSDRDGGYRYQATHPFTGNAWPAIPLSVLNIWRALSSYAHPPEACLVNFYDFSARMGLHRDRDETALAAPWSQSPLVTVAASVTAVCGGAIRQRRSNCAPAMLS